MKAHISPKMGRSGITFAVDSVTQAEKPIWSETVADSLSRRLQRRIFVLPHEQDQVINAHRDLFEERMWRIDEKQRANMISRLGSRCHPFTDAVHIAFSQHRPLTLSPDAIWLLIAQGFSHHIAENAELLRPRLVRHESKRELRVEASDFTLIGFEEAISGFSLLIRQAIDPVGA